MNDLINLFNKHVDDFPQTQGSYYKNGDFLTYVDGIFFLVQREHDVNNVVAFRYSKINDEPLTVTIHKFVTRCIFQGIRYLRVESKTNRWLPLFKKLAPRLNVSVLPDDEKTDKDVLYLKLY